MIQLARLNMLAVHVRRLEARRPSRSAFMVIEPERWNRMLELSSFEQHFAAQDALDAYHSQEQTP